MASSCMLHITRSLAGLVHCPFLLQSPQIEFPKPGNSERSEGNSKLKVRYLIPNLKNAESANVARGIIFQLIIHRYKVLQKKD